MRESKYNNAHGIIDRGGIDGEEIAESRIAIELTTNDKQVNDQVRQALTDRGDIYDHVGQPAIVVDGFGNGETRKQIKDLSTSTLCEIISQTCVFQNISHSGSACSRRKPVVRVPTWSCEAIIDGGGWPGLPQISGIVTGPLLRKDGTILQEQGYDPDSNLCLDLQDTFPGIPSAPSAAEVQQAVADLLDTSCRQTQFEPSPACVGNRGTEPRRTAYENPDEHSEGQPQDR